MKLVVREMIMIIISKDFFSIVLNGFVFLGQLLKANEIKKSLVNDAYFVHPSQKR